jgi:hypothetical protein
MNINRNILGGFDGLKTLFEIFINDSTKNGCCDFNEISFEEFISGKTKKLLGWESGNDYKTNTNDDNDYHFTNFYETNFSFEFTNSLFDFGDKYVLQGTLNLIEKFKNEENIVEKDVIIFVKSILMLLETEIKKSNNCKEIDNPILYEKLTYMKNGYIETYNKVYDFYSHYFPTFTKVDFKENIIFDNQPKTKETLKGSKKIKLKKTVFDYFNNVKDKTLFLNELKETFPDEIGKSIRVIIDYLKVEEILIIPPKHYKNFVDVLGAYFERHIGEYSGIQNKINIDELTKQPIESKLKPLISTHKTNS